MEHVRRFPADVITRALEDWSWLPDLEGKQVIATSAFGDVLLQGEDGVWFLDTVEGSLSREWDDAGALQAALNTPEGQDTYLMGGLVEAAHAAGLEPGDDEVLSFVVAPVLGGAIEVENVETADVVVSLSVAGQIHQQVKDLPPGTSVSSVTVDGS
ncbi:DUF1851 domain-containing protein [Rothia sp. ARF10]|nr:DUF1851 domain-containing protein [Rothia sp. ARF10]